MMTSLIDLLRDTLPIHASWSDAEDGAKSKGTPPAANFKRTLKIMAPGAALSVPPPPVPDLSKRGRLEKIQSAWGLGEMILTAPLWGYTLQAPNKVTNMTCRAREAGYKLHGVCPNLTYGLDGQPLVKVETKDGEKLDLPLENKFLLGQFSVIGGVVPEGKRTMWPLEMNFDKGAVMVFVYEPTIDNSGKLKTPLNPFAPRGKDKWKPVREDEKKTFEQMLPGDIKDKDAWLEAFTGPFMNVPGQYKQTTAKTREDKTTYVSRPRFVVVISIGVCKERADFEPGGLVGMAKIFPNIMIAASVPLKTSESSVKIERTAATSPMDAGDGTHKGTCCNAYTEVGAMLVTDDNEHGGVLSQKPFWGGTFAYVEEEANKRLGGQKLHIVDTSKTTERTFPGGKRLLVFRGTPNNFLTKELYQSIWEWTPYTQKGVKKVPRQGEFDNIHMAPPLKLDLAKIYKPEITKVLGVPAFSKIPAFFSKGNTVDPATCKTDKVWMAPFCAHDCFHTHWRWAKGETAKWTFGWNENGPHQESGTPMVPIYQDVFLKIEGPNIYSYSVKSTYPEDFHVGKWDIYMHHGAAYAQSIANWLKFQGSNFNLMASQSFKFYDSKDKQLTVSNAPLMYWLFRWVVGAKDGKAFVTPRIQHTQDEVDKMRKF